MSKKFYDSQESNRLSDLDILPLSHLLYMTLRLAFDKSPDCGLFQCTVKQMMSITGIFDRNLIVEVLLPELKRHNLVYFDNNVVFVPGTAETESCESKLHSGNKHHTTAFLNALKDCESIVSVASNCGGQNLAVKQFIEYWSESIDLLISDMAASEAELSALEIMAGNNTINPDQAKRLVILKKAVAAFYSCKTIAARKKFYSQNSSNPSRTHAEPIGENLPTHPEPIGENLPTHPEPIQNPSRTHPELIPDFQPTHLGFGYGKKGEEEKFPISGENREGAWGNKNGSGGGAAPHHLTTTPVTGRITSGYLSVNGTGGLHPSPTLNGINPLHSKDSLSQSQPLEYESTARKIQRRHAEEAAAAQHGSTADDDSDTIQPHPG